MEQFTRTQTPLALYADEHTLQMWDDLLANESDLIVVAQGGSSLTVMRAIQELQPHGVVLLLEMHENPTGGLLLLPYLAQSLPPPASVIVGIGDHGANGLKALDASAVDYLPYNDSIQRGKLAQCVRNAVRVGYTTLERSNHTCPCPLTHELKETLVILAQYRNVKQAANKLHLSTQGINRRIGTICDKLQLEQRSYHVAIQKAVAEGWISLPPDEIDVRTNQAPSSTAKYSGSSAPSHPSSKSHPSSTANSRRTLDPTSSTN